MRSKKEILKDCMKIEKEKELDWEKIIPSTEITQSLLLEILIDIRDEVSLLRNGN